MGVRHYNGVVHPNELVNLKREPYNPYDGNAIKVTSLRGGQVGHIKGTIARVLARPADDRNVWLVSSMLE